MNYYMGMPAHVVNALKFAGVIRRKPGNGASDMGWPIDPRGLEEAVLEADRRYQKPVIITENGIADASDDLRPGYLVAHVSALERAARAGARVDGYYHWSLVDNFEWHEGYGPRFGLYAIDYETQERTARPSCEVYRRIIKAHVAELIAR